jgi:hypothetical protein
MEIINLSQAHNTDAWLNERLGRITGTKSGDLALEPYKRTNTDPIIQNRNKALERAKAAKTKDENEKYYQLARKNEELLTEAEHKNKRLKTGIEFWKFLAETMADQPDNENPMERGHRLEPENIRHTLQQLGYLQEDCVTDCGIWESDEDDRIACSPDAYENTADPTWAIECKSLSSAYHLQTVIPWMIHKQALDSNNIPAELADITDRILPEYTLDPQANGLDFVPDKYKSQVLQYFVVCDTLKTLYFSMYDPRIFGEANHQIIPVFRKDIETLITEHKQRQLTTLHCVDTIQRMTGATFQ